MCTIRCPLTGTHATSDQGVTVRVMVTVEISVPLECQIPAHGAGLFRSFDPVRFPSAQGVRHVWIARYFVVCCGSDVGALVGFKHSERAEISFHYDLNLVRIRAAGFDSPNQHLFRSVGFSS